MKLGLVWSSGTDFLNYQSPGCAAISCVSLLKLGDIRFQGCLGSLCLERPA